MIYHEESQQKNLALFHMLIFIDKSSLFTRQDIAEAINISEKDLNSLIEDRQILFSSAAQQRLTKLFIILLDEFNQYSSSSFTWGLS